MVMRAADRRLLAFEWTWHTFLGQFIDVYETNTFLAKFFSMHENCGRHCFGRFVGVRVGVAGSQISTSSQRLHEQSDRRTRLVILVKNIYFMGSETFPSTCYIIFPE